MDLDLSGKTALVSGSTGGIGFAIAAGLAGQGAAVWVNGRTQARVDEAIGKLRAIQPEARAKGVAADLGTAEGVAAAVAALPDVDILINNVGIFEPKPFADIPDADWQRFFDVNVMSGVRLTRHYLPAMLARGWGRILFVSSESAVNIPVEMIHYGMTKTAMLAIARGVAELTTGTEVTVNTILPGPTKSEGVATFVEQLAKDAGIDFAQAEKDFFATHRPSSLLRRFASVEEVANLAIYLSSKAASATNGAAMRVEGGLLRSIV